MQSHEQRSRDEHAELYCWLRRTLRQHRLGTFTNTLLRDAVTVALGGKPAALLDFHLPPPVLDLVLQRIRATDPPCFSSLSILALDSSSVDSAVFLLHRPSFQCDAREPSNSAPLVDISASLSSPQLLTGEDAVSVTELLHSFTSSLSAALKANPCISSLTLTPPPGLCMPTLCGWLLSYPVLYIFPSTPDVPSTNCLSHQPLTLFTTRLHPTAQLTRLSALFASNLGGVMLQSFSVPTALLFESDVAAAIHVWEQRMGETCKGDALKQWVQQLSVDRTAICLPHVSL